MLPLLQDEKREQKEAMSERRGLQESDSSTQ